MMHFENALVQGVFETIQHVDMPMFILTVAPDQVIRFGALNAAHEATTGMQTAQIANARPHDVLPLRMADTVMANYDQCLKSRGTYTYEEVLDMPAGRFWWQTTLTPLHDSGRIVAIVGAATNITALRQETEAMATGAEAMRKRTAMMESAMRGSAAQLRGPLNNIITLGRMLRAELKPPLEKKEQLLGLMLETAVHTISQIDALEKDCADGAGGRLATLRDIDFAHMCRDVAALVDPDRELSIAFPDARLTADIVLFEAVLQDSVGHAARNARSRVDIRIRPDARRIRSCLLGVQWDDRGDAKAREQEAVARNRIEAYGGDVMVAPNGDDPATRRMEIVMPGEVLPSYQRAPAGISASRLASD
ncbi:MAG: PAS domain-containing protein [Pseudomonadota bacterium]